MKFRKVTPSVLSSLVFAIFGMVAMVGTGCGNNGNSDGGGGGSATQAGVASDLQGDWNSNCSGATSFGLAERSRLSIRGFEATRVSSVSASGSCSSSEVEVTQVGTHARQGEAQAGLNAIDITVNTIRVRPINQLGVDILKLANWCGFSDWAVGVEKDVSSKTGSDRCFPKVPTTIYTVYSIESGNRLLFGKDGDLSSPSNRPTEVDTDLVYRR